jgi:predicted nucleic acid-binding protein
MAPRLETARVFLDANVFIYLIEGAPDVSQSVLRFMRAAEVAKATLVTGDLVMAECLMLPLRRADRALAEAYESVFGDRGGIERVTLDGALAIEGARLGAPLGLKLIDAIHYASALRARCDLFVSADRRIARLPDMTVTTLAPWAA